MSRDEIRDFVIKEMQKKYTLKDDLDIDSLNYVEGGYVDSIELLQFLVEIEDHFGFEFSDDELVDPSIHVVSGLIDIIGKKMV